MCNVHRPLKIETICVYFMNSIRKNKDVSALHFYVVGEIFRVYSKLAN